MSFGLLLACFLVLGLAGYLMRLALRARST
jgi:hypothetical protein